MKYWPLIVDYDYETDICDIIVPLTDLPYNAVADDIEISGEDVPLGDAPQTGDHAMLSCLIALLAASMTGMAVVLIEKMKKRQGR